MSDPIRTNVRILDTEYRVSCGPEEKEELQEAARYLDEEMRKIRGSGKVIGLDRIAVMAALNIAHEMLSDRNRSTDGGAETGAAVRRISERVDRALEAHRQLEL